MGSMTRPMVLYLEEYSGGTFSGKLLLPEDRNSIATIRGAVVDDFSDFVERSKWRHVDGFPSAVGTWMNFTTISSVQGGRIALNAAYYAVMDKSGRIRGVAFERPTASEPWISFSFSLRK